MTHDVESEISKIVARESPLIQLVVSCQGTVTDIFEAKASDMMTKRGKLRKHVLVWVQSTLTPTSSIEVVCMKGC